MKKIFGFLICTLLISVRVYAVDDIPTDKSYTFDRANVASVLAEFIEDEKKAEKAADKYNELSNNIENAISAVDFVDVCVAGGMNMKLVDGSGYIKCLDMFMRLIEMQNLDAGGFDMYCPATGNALKSITDKTQVGDVCGGTRDTYIEYGYVTLKTDDKNGQHKYVCTCTPQSCKDGYYWNKEKHQCSVKDKDGYCVRHILGSFEYRKGILPPDYSGVGIKVDIDDWSKKSDAYYNDRLAQIMASADALIRCAEYGANQGCRIRGALASVDFGSGFFGNAKKYRVICNPAKYEIEADKKIQEDKEKKHKAELAENMTYYEACGKDDDKGICIDNVFTRKIIGGTQVDPRGAAFLAEEYARVHFNDEIKCKADKEGIRKVLSDYFIKCRSVEDLSKYYEFKFDDTEEPSDDAVRRNVDRAICEKIYGFKLNGNICETSKENCTGKIIPAYKRYYGDGRAHAYYGLDRFAIIPDYTSQCRINHTPLFENPKLSNDFGDKLDNYAFCKNTYNQLRNDDNLIDLIKEYMSSQLGINKYLIECVPASKTWPGGCSAEPQNMMEFITNPSDNLISCHVDDKWVDFVFDDTRELSKKLSEVSMDAMQCVIGGNKISITLGFELDAKNKGKKCTGLDDKLCKDLDKMIRNRGGSGAQYDTKKRACILNSAEEYANQELAQNVAIGAVVAVGTSIFVIGSSGVGAALIVGGSMFAVDTAVNGGLYIAEKLEDGQVGRRFRKFIDAAKKCKDSTCAQNVIKNHYNDLASGKEDYNYEDAAELQKELDRLFGLMEGDFCWQDQNGNILNPDSNGKCDKLVAIIHLDAEDKSLQRASIGLMIGGSLFNPESAMMKLASKGGRFARMLSNFKKLDSYRVKSIYYKIEDGFDMKVFGIKTSGGELRVEKSKLSDEEWEILRKDLLEKDNLIITATNDGYFVIHPDINALKNRASKNFDQYLQQCMSGGGCVGLPKSRLSDDEWNQLNKYVRDQGMALFERKMLDEKTGKWELVMQFGDFDPSGIRQGYKVNPNYSVANGGSDINSLLRGFNKTPVFHSGRSDALGHDYYRIMITDGDDVNGILSMLQSNGYYVSANGTGNEKFLAASKENIFGPWDNSKYNWLKYSRPSNTDKIDDIRKKALVNFNDSLNELKNGKIKEFFIPKSKLTEEELTVLIQDLKTQGLEVEEYSGTLRVKKSGTAAMSLEYNITSAYEKLDSDHREIVDRLNELTRRQDWEYKTAQELGATDGAYRINLAHLDRTGEEEYALVNKFEKANIKFKFEIGQGRNRYLVISEQDIGDVGKIKPASVIVDEAKKTGMDFLGKLKGWKVDNVERVTYNYRNSVFKFKETTSGKTYFLKCAPDADEANRTKRAYEILNGKSDIVHTVKVVEDDQEVLIDFAAKNNLLRETSGEYWFLTEELPVSTTPWEMLDSKNSLEEVLRGKPITVAEQKEIRQAVGKLNSSGIVHGDLEHNMFFMREPNGKLRVDIIDYERTDDIVSFVDDKKWLDETFDKLNKAGLAEK